jgi:t-SNARE complex subunit (syntaxin)
MSSGPYQAMSNSPTDKLQKVNAQVTEVTELMRDNIDKTIQRGEKIDVIHDKAQDLEINAQRFNKAAKKLRCMFVRQNIKNLLIIAFIFAVVLVLILAISGAFK